MTLTIAKKLGFDAAHFLPNYDGKCRSMHGHHWEIELACSGEVARETGMVVDFIGLKEVLRWTENMFDHKLINDLIETPTAENIIGFILPTFKEWCKVRNLKWAWIKIWETENSYAAIFNES